MNTRQLDANETYMIWTDVEIDLVNWDEVEIDSINLKYLDSQEYEHIHREFHPSTV